MWLFYLVLATPAMATTITVNTPEDFASQLLASARPPGNPTGRDTITFAIQLPSTITSATLPNINNSIDNGGTISGLGGRPG